MILKTIKERSEYIFNFKEVNYYLCRISIDYHLSNVTIRDNNITYERCFYLSGKYIDGFISYSVNKLSKGSKFIDNIYNYTMKKENMTNESLLLRSL